MRLGLRALARAFRPAGRAIEQPCLAVVGREVLLFLARGDAHDLDGVADHVAGALLADFVAKVRQHLSKDECAVNG